MGFPELLAAELQDLSSHFAFAHPIGYAQTDADAQRQLCHLDGQWRLVLSSRQKGVLGVGPPFLLACDRRARRAALIVPGTQSVADLAVDLRALPERVNLGPGQPS